MYTKRQTFSRANIEGAHPGHIESSVPLTDLSCLVYDTSSCTTQEFSDIDELGVSLESQKVHWLHLAGDVSAAQIGSLSSLGFSPLALEDVVNGHHRAKYEEFSSFDFWIARIPHRDLTTSQFSILVKGHLVVSIAPGEDLVCSIIRDRVVNAVGRIRRLPASYLAYALLDVIVDKYFQPIEAITEHITNLENTVIQEQKTNLISSIHTAKNQLLVLRKLVIANRDMLTKALNSPGGQVAKKVIPYMRDGKDHAIQQIEEIDLAIANSSNLMDLALSLADHNANETMRFLTVVASIFIPLTFIAGIYGMNFNAEKSPYNMPELHWTYGYPVAIGIMILVAFCMLAYFRKRKWI